MCIRDSSNTAQIGPEIAATLGIADVSGASFISFEKEGGLIAVSYTHLLTFIYDLSA